MLFTSALQNVYCRTDGVHAGQSWMGGAAHVVADASVLAYFQFRIAFISNLRVLRASLTRCLPYN